jgi:transglutaminase-like putative cysteine protease
MQLRILHRTAYRYDEPVKYSAQALRLTPRRDGQQRVLNWAIRAPGRRIEQVDAHGNVTHLLTLEDPHKQIEIIVTGSIEVASEGSLVPHEGQLSPLAYLGTTPLTAANPALQELSREFLAGGGSLRERLYALGATAASHAWADVWLVDAKAWLGVDVTHRELTGVKHCRLAVGRDYLDAAPVRGVRRGGGREMMEVDVTVSKAFDQ